MSFVSLVLLLFVLVVVVVLPLYFAVNALRTGVDTGDICVKGEVPRRSVAALVLEEGFCERLGDGGGVSQFVEPAMRVQSEELIK